MKVLILVIAQKEFRKLPLQVQDKFDFFFAKVRNGEELNNKVVKSLNIKNLFEFRVKLDKNIYRAIAMRRENFIILLFFQKKSQKIPLNILKTASKRAHNYEN